MSVRQSPAAPILTMTSNGPSIFGSSISSTRRLSAGMLSSYLCRRAAFTLTPFVACFAFSLPHDHDSRIFRIECPRNTAKVLRERQGTLRYTLRPEQADVAQLVEQLTRNEQVSGSSPLVGSLFYLGFAGKTYWRKATKLCRSTRID